jgi:hypothetical protein
MEYSAGESPRDTKARELNREEEKHYIYGFSNKNKIWLVLKAEKTSKSGFYGLATYRGGGYIILTPYNPAWKFNVVKNIFKSTQELGML